MPTSWSTSAEFSGERREAFSIDSQDGHALGATLHRPLAQEPRSGVVLIPGWSGPRTGPAELLVQLAARLAREGHAVLRIDLHGRGDSSGRFEDGDLDRMIADASAALDLLRERLGRDVVGWTAGGICSGGNVALGLASLRPDDVHAAIALSTLPFQPARSADFERRRRWKNVKALAKKALSPRNWARLAKGEVNVGRVTESVTGSEKKAAGERNLKDSARDIERALLGWKGRALFVWGGGDEEAPPARAHFEKLHAQGCAQIARFEILEGANHNFYARAWRAHLERMVLQFLAP